MIKWNGPAFWREMQAANKKALTKAAVIVTRSVKDSFPDSGIESATKAERRANASAPGEIPHVQTGHLRRSIAYELVGSEDAKVGTNVKYGRYLELGTPTMEARPYLRPALDREHKTILKAFANTLK